ncbi:MAG: ABC transporter substrate-binding protein [Acholeplasma sp.]|jgi:ABC-type glycerol-3-phosphate transport system substrate-binding protein|nr:ABC transporter substrate-binding protein [Acholeplasma sp.]
MKKRLTLLITVVALAFTLAACSEKTGLDADAAGEITVMLYNGDGNTYEDLGHQTISTADITDDKLGLMYAVTKEFNKHYPNVKVNVHFKLGDSYNWDTKETWAQYRSNYEQQTGTKVDIWSATDLAGDTTRGLVADLSVFKDDAMYKSINPAFMNMLNYYGVQAGLPEYLVPWGVYVNRDFAEEKNLDVPTPDWTIEEYTEFVSHSQENEFYGTENPDFRMIQTGASTITQQLLKQGVDGDYVNVNSDEVRALIPNITKWAQNALWTTGADWSSGGTTGEFYGSGGWWGHNFFKQGKMLTNSADPWMLGDAANPLTSELMLNDVDWDYYPRPSTAQVDNTVGIVLDPIAVRNYAMDDSDVKLSDTEKEKLEIAYTFASFWVADTRSWEAQSAQQYNNAGKFDTVMSDSFPVTIGDAFDEQMAVWYSLPTHEYFKDAERTPGFQKILEIFNEGKIYDVADKAYPWNFTEAGETKQIFHEWNQMGNPATLTGNPEATSPEILDGVAFTDAVLAKLPEWNVLFNARFEAAFNELKAGLEQYYGKTQKDF